MPRRNRSTCFFPGRGSASNGSSRPDRPRRRASGTISRRTNGSSCSAGRQGCSLRAGPSSVSGRATHVPAGPNAPPRHLDRAGRADRVARGPLRGGRRVVPPDGIKLFLLFGRPRGRTHCVRLNRRLALPFATSRHVRTAHAPQVRPKSRQRSTTRIRPGFEHVFPIGEQDAAVFRAVGLDDGPHVEDGVRRHCGAEHGNGR